MAGAVLDEGRPGDRWSFPAGVADRRPLDRWGYSMSESNTRPSRPLENRTVTRTERSTARIIVALSLMALGYGTVAGSSPSWPDPVVYASVCWATAALWIVCSIEPRQDLIEVADAALLALGLIRAAGYTSDLVRSGEEGYIAAIAAWMIVVVLVARPMRKT